MTARAQRALAVLPECLRDRVTVQMMARHHEIEQEIPEGLSPEGERCKAGLNDLVYCVDDHGEVRSSQPDKAIDWV